MRYEDETFQETVINNFGHQILTSGIFQNLLSEIFSCELNYPIDNYLLFLDSCSPYQTLDSEIKKQLFAGLKAKIEDNCAGIIKTSYLSAFHIAQKS
ncbi:hypothetical protein [Nostoc sp. FACHB-110]|uniref:hypothetical protein n=1 Tax=Nostoc sp. FACHB-110 TaxID=2692834 RepID=UPI0028C3CAEC|nr:hypothetical protein [Nostoc sp. FACHB-110]